MRGKVHVGWGYARKRPRAERPGGSLAGNYVTGRGREEKGSGCQFIHYALTW